MDSLAGQRLFTLKDQSILHGKGFGSCGPLLGGSNYDPTSLANDNILSRPTLSVDL